MKTKEMKKIEAEKRQDSYFQLPIAKKITKLNQKLGIDQGAKKERSKLISKLACGQC